MPEESNLHFVREMLRAVTACLSPASAEALSCLRAPDSVQARLEILADRNTEGMLTNEEREEYEELVSLGSFVSLLQAHARRQLAASQAT